MTDPLVNTREVLASMSDDKLLDLAEAIEQERRNRRRGVRNMQFNPQQRKWERRVV